MRWSSYFDLAQELYGGAAGTPFEEAKLRSAISRAYYAVFNEGRVFLGQRVPNIRIPSDGAAHKVVADAFIDNPSNDPNWISVGVIMGRLKRNRTKADYDASVPKLLDLTQVCLREAATVLTFLQTL
jgi:uncharacterized protein (UPF0332 family)